MYEYALLNLSIVRNLAFMSGSALNSVSRSVAALSTDFKYICSFASYITCAMLRTSLVGGWGHCCHCHCHSSLRFGGGRPGVDDGIGGL